MIEQLLYWVIQENSIEFLVQSSLPYILLLMVHAHCCAPYPNDHVYDMRPACVVYAVWRYFIPKPSTSFSHDQSCDYAITLWLMWQCDWWTLTWVVLKIKEKEKKNKVKRKNKKIKSTINDLDNIYRIYKSNSKWLRYQAISSCKSFIW